MHILPPTVPGGRFLGASASWETSRVVLVGVPLDVTVTYRPGTRFAPARIRQVSEALEEYSLRLNRSLSEIGLGDAGDLVLAPGEVEASLARVEECAIRVAEEGRRAAFLGGEHLLTYAVVKGLLKVYPDLAVLHWDAHADLRSDYMGREFSHATVMRMVAGLGVPLYQMGVRSLAPEEVDFLRAFYGLPSSGGLEGRYLKPGCGGFFPEEILSGMEQVLAELERRPVYLSLDVDVLDPAFAPGTGAPEPGGIAPPEVFRAIELLRRLDVVGFDLVEVNPLVDVADCTALLAAKMVRELLLVVA